MSIIYEALKKVENQKNQPPVQKAPEKPSLPIQKQGKPASQSKKSFFLFLLLLAVLGLFFLQINLARQEGKAKALTSVRKIDPARVYESPNPESTALNEPVIRVEPRSTYILEGIVYDQEASFVIINGRVMEETDKIGSFRIDKISEDKVEMIGIEDNNKVTLSLP